MKAFFVSKRLAFGSAIKTREHVRQLRALGITHVINLRWSSNNAKVRQFRHTWLRFHDDKEPRPRWFYRRALKFYSKAMKDSRAKVFVMCHHGQCRSASLAYFFLRMSGTGAQTAERRIQRARARHVSFRPIVNQAKNISAESDDLTVGWGSIHLARRLLWVHPNFAFYLVMDNKSRKLHGMIRAWEMSPAHSWDRIFLHESGHALMGALQGLECNGVAFYKEKNTACALVQPLPEKSDYTRAHRLFLAAGSAAEMTRYDGPSYFGANSDRKLFGDNLLFNNTIDDAYQVLVESADKLAAVFAKMKGNYEQAACNFDALNQIDVCESGVPRKMGLLLSADELVEAAAG